MAAETEGIAALFSMYNDDDDEDDERREPEGSATVGEPGDDPGGEAAPTEASVEIPSPALQPRSPLLPDEVGFLKTLTSPVPLTPPLPPSQHSSPFPFTSPSPLLHPAAAPPAPVAEPSDLQRTRRGALAIVDYAHDETAMSPEPEEGEIMAGGCIVFGMELQVANENIKEQTPSGTVHTSTPKTQLEPSQPSDTPDQSLSETNMTVDVTETESEVAQPEESSVISIKIQQDDPLSRFLPPPVTIKCSEELQQKINRFLAYRKSGKSFNADLHNRKDYRNPDFLLHAVHYQEIDQIGTCFSKDVFDPHGYDKGDYYDEIEADMKPEIERRDQERKKSQKVDFVAGVQPATMAPILRTTAQTQVACISAAGTSGLIQVLAAIDATAKDSRQNKKTKWDKIDGEIKNPSISGGQDDLPAVSVHAALLAAGSGYSAFAQQKRREAEEKRTSDRKPDKRS